MAKKTVAVTKAPNKAVIKKIEPTLLKQKKKLESVTISGRASFASLCPPGVDSVVFKFIVNYEDEDYNYIQFAEVRTNLGRSRSRALDKYGVCLAEKLSEDFEFMPSIITHLIQQINIPNTTIRSLGFNLLIEFSSTGNILSVHITEPSFDLYLTLSDTYNVPNVSLNLDGFYELKTKIKNTVTLFAIKL
jgi:hypothetical protein